jgi:hypothetical protein
MANTAIKTIGKRAKELYRKSGKKKKYMACVKEASAEYRAGKIGAKTKVNKYRQTGTSNRKNDRDRSARPPGARIPKGGKKVTYYERRKNRSDVPGKLTGTAYNSMILSRLSSNNSMLREAEEKMRALRALLTSSPKNEKGAVRRAMIAQGKYISSIKKDIRMLRVLLK